MRSEASVLLKTENLRISLKNGDAGLRDLSMSVMDGEIVALMGRQGSGKSLALRAIMGYVPTDDGNIGFGGESIDHFDTQARIKSGLSFVPQTRRIFKNITVRENLVLGGRVIKDVHMVRDIMDDCLEIFPRLRQKMSVVAGMLSSGEQVMLAISRALMSNPLLLMIDELCLGISPLVRDDIFDKLRILRQAGLAMLIAERKGMEILDVADRAYLIENGRVAAIGDAQDFKGNERIVGMFEKEDESAW